ncbi:MAG TPA: helix-hairpin-helix domain-containing protein [Vicinamibacteria bacterium]|nr:helix-hairpin-helix domain-containing protein [Vicinamibacteria bacterium]
MASLVRRCALACALIVMPLSYATTVWARESPAGAVDLNSASLKDLEGLPGVGAATAKKIVAGRPYASVGDLAKAGVPKTTIEKITPLVSVGAAAPAAVATTAPAAHAAPAAHTSHAATAAPSASAPIDLNTATDKELVALPGVGPATAKKIIAARPYAAVADLSRAGVSASTIQKIAPQVFVTAPAVAAAPIPVAPAPMAPATPAPQTVPARATPPVPAAAAPAATSAAAQPPLSNGMVWVNTSTKVFHREGDRWYGKTKEGKYMTEAAALAAGYREAKSAAKKSE